MRSGLMEQASRLSADIGAKPDRRLLHVDAQAFRECFDRRPFMIGHHLVGNPLFDLPRLLRLAQTLPEADVEYNAGDIPVNQAPDSTPRTGLSAGETIRRIAQCKSWLVLKYVENDPDYRVLLHQCLAEVATHSEPIRPGMHLAQGFVFISSPGSVTPYHMDPEHNFLLQIRGSKRIHLFDGRDPTILSAEDLEQHYRGAHRNLVFRDELETKGWTFDLKPGFGLHFPVTAPHYVKNGSEVSVSFSITFRTPDIARRGEAHNFNAFLRRNGLRPAPVGMHPWRDQLKSFTFRAGRQVHRLLGGRTR
jgi:hypothetical protein